MLHVGCGVGYYTAIIAEVVGPLGRVVGVALDADLAARAHSNLAHLGHVTVVQGDGGEYDPGPMDAIFVNAGATHPRSIWLDRLRPGGRLLLPLTAARDEASSGMGFVLKVTRHGDGYPARFVSPVGIFPCIGSRDAELNQQLREAMARGTWSAVSSLRRDPHESAATCWLNGAQFCLSTRPA